MTLIKGIYADLSAQTGNICCIRVLFVFFIFNFQFSTFNLFAQQHKIDSLLGVLKVEKEDTERVNTLNNLAYILYAKNPDSGFRIAQQAEDIATKLDWKKGMASAYNVISIGYFLKGDFTNSININMRALKIDEEMGNKIRQALTLSNICALYEKQNNYPKAIDCGLKALKIYQETGNLNSHPIILSNLGGIYYEQGDYPLALDYCFKALQIYEKIGGKRDIAGCLGNIGLIYNSEKNLSEALDYDLKALKLYEEIEDKQGQASVLGNLGSVYEVQKDYAKALDYELKALKLSESLGNKLQQATNLGNIGDIYDVLGDYQKALDYDLQALKIHEVIGDKRGQGINLARIGTIFTKTGKFKQAEMYLKEAVDIDSAINEKDKLRQIEENLSHLYDTTGRYKLALYWYKKAMVLQDTLFNIDKSKAITRKELTYKFQRQQDSAKSAQAQIDAIHNEQVKGQRVVIYSISSGLILVLLLAISIFRSLQQSRKKTEIIETQKAEVEKKNEVIEEKNRDIISSITYAKRLQDAILPPVSLIKQYFPESFVLYKPKDIVAGDFYWLAPLPPKGGGKASLSYNSEITPSGGGGALIAACDCTGHGVPGAMVSVVCSNALNRAVKEFHLTEPGKILDKTRELVLEAFSASGNINDGMDISLLAISRQSTANSFELQWAGAYNSLWVVPPPIWGQKAELQEIPADKQPIGYFPEMKPFTNHVITFSPLRSNIPGCLYLITDGFADQFGGPKGKKFKYAQLKEKLTAICNKPMEEQKDILEKEFEQWKGELEQTDDVCMIGIRI